MLVCASIYKERFLYGKPVNLPEAYYGKVSSYSPGTEFLFITIDNKGKMYLENDSLSLSKLKMNLSQYTNHVVSLRIDRECKFEDIQEVVSLLQTANVVNATFSVNDE